MGMLPYNRVKVDNSLEVARRIKTRPPGLYYGARLGSPSSVAGAIRGGRRLPTGTKLEFPLKPVGLKPDPAGGRKPPPPRETQFSQTLL